MENGRPNTQTVLALFHVWNYWTSIEVKVRLEIPIQPKSSVLNPNIFYFEISEDLGGNWNLYIRFKIRKF